MATLLWLDGFEHGAAVAGVAGIYDTVTATPAIVTTPVRTGLRSLEVSASGAAEHVQYSIAAGNRIITQAAYFRFATLPSADVRIMEFNNATAGNGNVWFQNSGDQIAVSIGGGALVAGGPALSVDTWYRLVVEYDTSTATATIKAKVDNGTEFSQTVGITASDISSLRLGTNGAHTYTCYYDDWLISVTDGDYEDIGAWTTHRVESLIPNSDGTHNIVTATSFNDFSGTNFTNSTTNGNTYVGHRPLQRANTAGQVIRQQLAGTTEYMEFGSENLSDNTDAVAGVRTYASFIQSTATGTSPKEARLLLSDNTEVLTTGSLSVIDTTADPGLTLTVYKRMTVDPSGGWDGTKVDGLKWRIGFSDGAPDDNFIDLMAEVAQYEAAVTITGVVLTVTPSLPTGSLTHTITGAALSVTPSLPTGAVNESAAGQTVTGVVLQVTPSLPTGSLTHTITGVVLTATPSLPTGKLDHRLTGVVVTATPSLPTGSLQHRITGAVLTVTPSLPTGALTHTVTGTALTATPSLPAGQVTIPGAQTVTGVVLQITPTLPAGSLRHSITGVALTATPTLPAGTLNHSVRGVVLTVTPTLPTGTVTRSITGVTLTATPTLPIGTVGVFKLLGVAVEITPTLPTGLVTTVALGTLVKGPTRKVVLEGPNEASELVGAPSAVHIGAGRNSSEEL